MSQAVAPALGLLKPRVSDRSHGRVLSGDLIALFQQLKTLFGAGTPLLEALHIAATQARSRKLADTVKAIAGKVAAGSPMHQAMDDYPKLFRPEWVEIVRCGEESGELEEVLAALAKQLDAAAQLRSKLVSAMMYPATILAVASVAVVVMLVKVVPTFAKMFDSFGKDLPAITQAVLDVSDFLRARWLVVTVCLVAVVVSVQRYLRTAAGRRRLHGLLVCLPVSGEITVQTCMQKFSNNLALLLRAGVPLHEAIGSLRGIFANNVYYQQALHQVEAHVGAGGRMADGLEDTGLFTSLVVSMVRIGEESGSLVEVLDELEIFYRRKVETVAARVSGLVETFAILGMGVAVAVVLCAIYLPLFSMASGV